MRLFAFPGMPNEVSILFNLGAALLSTEDLDGAVACFTQILAQDPHDAYSLAQLGQAQHMRGGRRSAEEFCFVSFSFRSRSRFVFVSFSFSSHLV